MNCYKIYSIQYFIQKFFWAMFIMMSLYFIVLIILTLWVPGVGKKNLCLSLFLYFLEGKLKQMSKLYSLAKNCNLFLIKDLVIIYCQSWSNLSFYIRLC